MPICADLAEGSPSPAVSGSHTWIADRVWPSGWGVVRGPQGKFAPQAFLRTDEAIAPGQVLSWFVRRWQMEVTFEEAREHPGMERQRQWSDRAIARTSPVLLGLYSLGALMARQVLARHEMPVRSACWYRKEQATFSDTIAQVRRCLWGERGLSIPGKAPDMVEIPRQLFERLTDTLSYAACMDKVEELSRGFATTHGAQRRIFMLR